MKFAVERLAFVKMLKFALVRAPGAKRRDKYVRVTACAARVFIEANQCAAALESVVLDQGACSIQHEKFLKLLQSYAPKTRITVEVNEAVVRIETGAFAIVADYTTEAVAPWQYKVFPVTDVAVARTRPLA